VGSLGADALDGVRREPERQAAWLWLSLLPSLFLHSSVPTAASGNVPPHVCHPERVAALLRGDFDTCLSDRNAGVWRPSAVRRPGPRRTPASRDATVAACRLAVRLARVGRLRAAARALRADPPVPQTPAVERKARGLFPPAATDLATPASIEEGFPDELAPAEAHGRRSTVPAAVPWDAAVPAVRTEPRGSSPGPSGTRMEDLWALGEEGRDALVGVVLLLTGVAATTRVPAVATHAVAGADLLLLAKLGGVRENGRPGLRPIGMPEALRELAASALAATVRSSAADMLSPRHLGVNVPNACERILHELGAHLAHHPGDAVLQLDFKHPFNLVSRPAAEAVLHRALPVFPRSLGGVWGGGGACVFGWVVDAAAPPPPPGAGGSVPPAPPADGSSPTPPRWWLRAERAAQQGGPLGPLLHAAAVWLVLEWLRVDNPSVVVRAFHDDVVVVDPPAALRAVLDAAARLGGGVDAQLAPTKCVGWSPAGVVAPPGWPAQWSTEGLTLFSVSVGGADFVAAAVDGIATAQVALGDAIGDLRADQLQVQLLMLRLCAGRQANYWLRALPQADGARLAGAVDRGAQRVLAGLLCDACNDAATRAAVFDRAALPPMMGGLGIGERTAVAPAAALASRAETLRTGWSYSPALRPTADAPLRLRGAGGEPVVGAAGVAGGTSGTPTSAGAVARRAGGPPLSRASRGGRLAAAVQRPPPVAVARGAAAGPAFPWSAGHAAGRSDSALQNIAVNRAGGVVSSHFEPPPGEEFRPRVAPRNAVVRRLRSIPAPPPPPDDDGDIGTAPCALQAAPPAAPRPVPPIPNRNPHPNPNPNPHEGIAVGVVHGSVIKHDDTVVGLQVPWRPRHVNTKLGQEVLEKLPPVGPRQRLLAHNDGHEVKDALVAGDCHGGAGARHRPRVAVTKVGALLTQSVTVQTEPIRPVHVCLVH